MKELKYCIGVLCLSVLMSSAGLAGRSDAASSSPTAQTAGAAQPAQSQRRLVEPVDPTSSLAQMSFENADLQATLRALRARAVASGGVKVAVKLAVPFAPETLLNDADKLQQRREIASAVAVLQAAMPSAKGFTPQAGIPYVVMQVDTVGLARLEKLSGLTRITHADDMNWRRDLVELRSRVPGGRAPSELNVVRPNIVGGRVADPQTHPFQVALVPYFYGYRDDRTLAFCGGTLVSEFHVVTAAHCTLGFGELSVLVGSQRLDGSARQIPVTRVYSHPLYNDVPFDFDVAVLTLAEPVKDIPFATLAASEPTVAGTRLRATGWGVDGSPYLPTDLQQVDLGFVPGDAWPCSYFSTPRMFCAEDTYDKTICRGDSGGPLTINRGAGFTELVGISSWSYRWCEEGGAIPSGFANVANPDIRAFIDQAMAIPVLTTPSELQVSESGNVYRTVKIPAAGGGSGSKSVLARKISVPFTRNRADRPQTLEYMVYSGYGDESETAVQLPAGVSGFSGVMASGKYDFVPVSGRIILPVGQRTAVIEVPVIDDRQKERPETFAVAVYPVDDVWAVSFTTVTIIDND